MLILSLNDVSDIFPVQTTEGNFEAFRYRNRLYRFLNGYKTFAETLRACRTILDENIMCLITQEQGQGRLWVPLPEESVLEAKTPAPKPTFMMYRGAKVAMAQPQEAKPSNSPSAGQMMYRGNKLFH